MKRSNKKHEKGIEIMKKVLIFLPVLLLAIVTIALIIVLPSVTFSKSFEQVIGVKQSEITKIRLTSGTTGKAVTITDKAEFDKLLNMFEDTRFIYIREHNTVGWTLGIEIYTKESSTSIRSFTFGASDFFVSGSKDYYMNKTFTHEQIMELVNRYNLYPVAGEEELFGGN